MLHDHDIIIIYIAISLLSIYNSIFLFRTLSPEEAIPEIVTMCNIY